MIKKIGILTSGGDCPGMNYAVSTFIKVAIANNIKPYLIKDGYFGLTNGNIKEGTIEYADLIMNLGGTSIGSARFEEFMQEDVRKKAILQLKKYGIEALIVVGGDGSYKGALKLTRMGINCIGLPGTIDNDIASSDYTLGFNSTLNFIVDVIKSNRNTANSHNRCTIIETMGRNCGDLALFAAKASAVEVLSIPEHKLTELEIVSQVNKLKLKNRRSVIVLVTENIYDLKKLVDLITIKTGYITKSNVIGHMQRGIEPITFDKVLAYNLVNKAILELINNKGGECIGLINGKINVVAIEKALKLKNPDRSKEINEYKKIQESYLK